MISGSERKYYHMRIKYTSDGKTSFYYEVNKSKQLVNLLARQIDKLVSAIRFEGHRLYPRRVNEYKIFVTESPSEMNPESIRDEHPEGYDFGGNDVTLEISTDKAIPQYQCQKCSAPITSTDKICPNGHDLSIVGRKINLMLTDGMVLTESLNLKSGFVVKQIEKEVRTLAKDPSAANFEEALDVITGHLEALRDDSVVIIKQTSPPTFFERAKEHALGYVISAIIGGAAVGLWAWFAG